MILSVSLHQLKCLFKSQSLLIKNIDMVITGSKNLNDIIYNLFMLFVVHTVLFYLCSEGAGRNRTYDKAFAEPRLTTWLPRRAILFQPRAGFERGGSVCTRMTLALLVHRGQLFTDCHC